MNRLCFLLCTLVLVGCGDDGAAPMATTAEPSTSSGSSGDNDGSSGPPEIRADLGVEPPEVCEAFCAVTTACRGSSASDCLLQCTAELADAEDFSTSCGLAQGHFVSCIAGLSCEELATHDAGGEGPCRGAAQQTTLACDRSGNMTSKVCAGLCASFVTCELSEETPCLAGCAEMRSAAAASGESCGLAQDGQLYCLAQQDCAGLGEWMSTGSTQNCPDPLDEACAGDEE